MMEFIIGLPGLTLAEITHWGHSTRLRFVGQGGVEVKMDIPLSNVTLTNPEGTYHILLNKEEEVAS
jgi:hypothetical protein